MSNIQLRSEIGKLLIEADDRLLSSVYSMMVSYLEHEDSIVGFTVEGEPLTQKDLLQIAEESRKKGMQGQVISASNLLSEIDAW